MTKMELAQLTEAAFTDAEWEMLELVYLYHPAIDVQTGKEQIAYLWENFGPIVIRDLLPTARRGQMLEASVHGAEVHLRQARNDLAEFMRSGRARGVPEAGSAAVAEYLRAATTTDLLPPGRASI